jgi:hypothetical protein
MVRLARQWRKFPLGGDIARTVAAAQHRWWTKDGKRPLLSSPQHSRRSI